MINNSQKEKYINDVQRITMSFDEDLDKIYSELRVWIYDDVKDNQLANILEDLLDENEQEQEDDLEMLRSIFETEIEQYYKTYKRGK